MADTTTATKVIIDFSNVKESSGINPKHRPAGDYRMKVSGITSGPAKKDPSVTQWVFTFTPTDMQSATYPYYCQLVENQLWKVRNLLIACGISVPKKKVNVDPNRLVGREVGVTLDDDEYEGKLKSVITAVFPASDLEDDSTTAADEDDEVEDDVEDEPAAPADEPEDDDEEDEEPAPAPVRKAKKKPAPAPEPEVTDDDLEELDVEDL